MRLCRNLCGKLTILKTNTKKHNCKKLCEQKQENEYLFKKSILYFMEKNMKNTKKDTLKQGGSRRRQIRILKIRKITLYNEEKKKISIIL